MGLCSGIKRYISQLPFVQKTSAILLQYILACFAFLSPCWTFLFIKTPDSKMAKVDTTVDAMGKIIPNPFVDQADENGPTNTKS